MLLTVNRWLSDTIRAWKRLTDHLVFLFATCGRVQTWLKFFDVQDKVSNSNQIQMI